MSASVARTRRLEQHQEAAKTPRPRHYCAKHVWLKANAKMDKCANCPAVRGHWTKNVSGYEPDISTVEIERRYQAHRAWQKWQRNLGTQAGAEVGTGRSPDGAVRR